MASLSHLSAVVATSLLLAGAWGESSAQGVDERAEVTVAQASLRVSGTLDASISATLLRGAVVVILERTGTWARVRVEATDLEGWLRSSQVGPTRAPPARRQAAATLAPAPTPQAASVAREPGNAFYAFAGISAAGAEWQADGATTRLGGRKGVTAGVGVVRGGARTIGYELQLSWLQAGYATESEVGEALHTVNYIRGSGALQIRPPSLGLALLAGPFIGYPVGCSQRIRTTAGATDSPCSTLSNGDALEKLDVGASIGIAVAGRGLRLVLRYDHSLTDRLANEESLRNRGLQTVVAISF